MRYALETTATSKLLPFLSFHTIFPANRIVGGSGRPRYFDVELVVVVVVVVVVAAAAVLGLLLVTLVVAPNSSCRRRLLSRSRITVSRIPNCFTRTHAFNFTSFDVSVVLRLSVVAL